jgi:predicted acylesterase/phospholipase RssA
MSDSVRQPTLLERQGIDRIVRHLLGIRLGLALGGGAARGMAHLGVLSTFNQEGIGFDMVAGTSAGAMIGIPYAAGYTPELAIERYSADLTPPRLYRLVPGGLQWYLMLKYRTGAWDKMLRRYFFDWRLEQLQIPTYTVAVDLVSGSQIVRDCGDAVHAIVETINLPILSRPICRDGMALVDGGVLNTLPTKVLVERGADMVVAVSVSGKIRDEFSGNRMGMETSAMRRPGTFQTLRRVLETQDHALKAIDAQAADILIEPDATHFDMADFSRTREIAELGEAVAEQAIGNLKAMIGELEKRAMQEIEIGSSSRATL